MSVMDWSAAKKAVGRESSREEKGEFLLKRLRSLQQAGRRPELTAGDAARWLGASEEEARSLITTLVRARALALSYSVGDVRVWKLVDRDEV